MSDAKRAQAFEDLLIAAMKDAAIEMKLTQLKTTITPEETGKQTFIRIIIVPESMHRRLNAVVELRLIDGFEMSFSIDNLNTIPA